jgi:hypothetical protein
MAAVAVHDALNAITRRYEPYQRVARIYLLDHAGVFLAVLVGREDDQRPVARSPVADHPIRGGAVTVT